MGIKITGLPDNQLPYDGNELMAVVESGQTRRGSLSSFLNYLSGAEYDIDHGGSNKPVQPIASPLKNNYFCTTQTIAGNISGTGNIVLGENGEGGTCAAALGTCNAAAGSCATVAGGYEGNASGATSFVGGGFSNVASGLSSAVVGGASGRASGIGSIAGGGFSNQAIGNHSVLAGGVSRRAFGT